MQGCSRKGAKAQRRKEKPQSKTLLTQETDSSASNWRLKCLLFYELMGCWERGRPRPHSVRPARSDSLKEICLQPNSRSALSADEDVRASSNRWLISDTDDFLGKAGQL